MIIRLEAISHLAFHAAIFNASEHIMTCGGWIKNHELYSDLMAMIAFEMPASMYEPFAQALTSEGIKVKPLLQWPHSDRDISGQLTINFLSGTGDLRRPVLADG